MSHSVRRTVGVVSFILLLTVVSTAAAVTGHATGGSAIGGGRHESDVRSAPAGIGQDDAVARVATIVGDVVRRFPTGAFAVAGTVQRDRRVLENEGRRNVYEAVLASPGTYLAEVAAAVGVSWSTVRYHTRVLEEDGLVTSTKTRGRRRLYPTGNDEPELVAALEERPTATVLHALDRLEPVGVSALAADLGIAPSTASYHLTRLADDGLVDRERDGRRMLARLDPTVREWLDGAD